jgi:membrane-bound lytic murein transglycosylase D
MIRFKHSCARAFPVGAVALVLSGCGASVAPQRFRTYFVPPPVRPLPSAERPVVEAPAAGNTYGSELPFLTAASVSTSTLPAVPRPTDTDFLIRKADNHFNAGKKLFQDENYDAAQREFNLAVQTLMSAPEEIPERARVDKRLEELIDQIYRYDADLEAEDPEARKEAAEKSPIEEILNLTFPVDPALRNKVTDQIQATASQLPLEVNDAVVSYINFFSSERGKKILAFGLRQSGRYQPLISRVLAQEGIPQELIFLAQTESAFQPRAISRALCVGIWQFERFTGQLYSLGLNSNVDERMDPEKATRAAARLLHDLYMHFGDWNLAMAGYNCGQACVDRAIARTGYADFWELRRLNVLPKETANYVPAILAMTIVAKNAKSYGLDEVVPEAPLEYETIEVNSPTHLGLVAAALDRPLSELKDLNPSLLRQVAPAGYAVHIPKDGRSLVEEAFAVVPENRRETWRVHRIEPGDSFAALSKKYATAETLIQASNHDELPEPGKFAAIPITLPAERPASARRVVRHGVPQKQPQRVQVAAAHKTPPAVASVRAPQAKAPTGKVAAAKAPAKTAAHRPGA